MERIPSWVKLIDSHLRYSPRLVKLGDSLPPSQQPACHLSFSWARSIQAMPSPTHFLKIHFHIIVTSSSRSSKLPLSLRFPHSVYNSSLTHTCHIPRPSTFSLTSALDWGGWVNATPRPLYPRDRPGTHCIRGWGGPRAGLDGCEIYRPHRDSIPGPSSP